MKLTARVRYATRFIIELSSSPERSAVKASEIAMQQGISVKYLEQLIRPLKDAQIIDSVRGPKGGHTLVKSVSDITLGEIARIFEGPPKTLDPFSVFDDPAEHQDYAIRRAWYEATRALYRKLDQVSLDSLIQCTRK